MRATEQYGRLFKAALKEQKLNDYTDQGKRREGFFTTLKRNFRDRTVKPGDFSIREAFETFVIDDHGESCGRRIISDWGYANTRPEHRSDNANLHKLEEAGAVMTGAFSNITGQIVFNEVMDAWNNPAFIADDLARTVSTSFLDGERIPGVGLVSNENETIGEGQPYPLTGVSEEYVDMPPPDKRGSIIPLTRESIIGDRTGVLLERAASNTQSLRISKERRVIAVVTGITNNWNRNGVASDTYQDAQTNPPHDFDNELGTTPLVDYEDIDDALQLFSDMNDPNTGEPIVVMPTVLLVPPALKFTAQRILSATQIQTRTGAALAAGDPTEADRVTVSGNPLAGTNLTMMSSPFVARLGNDEDWFIGDPMRAFRYMEVWPINTVQAPTNSELEFTNDIVQQIKVSEYGVAGTVEARYMVRGNAT